MADSAMQGALASGVQDERQNCWWHSVGRWWDRFLEASLIVAAAAIFVMMLIMSQGVFSRYVLNSPVMFVEEITAYLSVLVIFLAAPCALLRDAHIKVQAITTSLGARFNYWLKVLTSLLTVGYLGLFTYQAWRYLTYNFQLGRRAMMIPDLPVWIPLLSMPVGFTLLLIVALAVAIRHFRSASKRSRGRG